MNGVQLHNPWISNTFVSPTQAKHSGKADMMASKGTQPLHLSNFMG